MAAVDPAQPEGVVREVAHAVVLALADAVFDSGAARVAQLQGGDVIVVLVGEQDVYR